jgi:hypothetical protein
MKSAGGCGAEGQGSARGRRGRHLTFRVPNTAEPRDGDRPRRWQPALVAAAGQVSDHVPFAAGAVAPVRASGGSTDGYRCQGAPSVP